MPWLAKVRKASKWWNLKPCLCLPAMQACVRRCETLVDLGRPRRVMKNMKLCESTKHMAEGPIWHMCYEEAKPVQKILTENYQLLNARSLQETQQTAMPKVHQKPSKVIKTTKDFSANSSSQMPREQWTIGTFFSNLDLQLIHLFVQGLTSDCFTRLLHTSASHNNEFALVIFQETVELLHCCVVLQSIC